jgi:NAD+ synthase (glutamine-hydrolysing)
VTLTLATRLATEIGCSFDTLNIEPVLRGFYEAWSQIGPRPDISQLDSQQNIACQNLQARSRMVMSYMCAQLLPWKLSQKRWPGALLVLGSSNLDEALRGYFTKYDCSSADLNPIGALSKVKLRTFLVWAARNHGMPTLLDIANSKASAELQPTAENGAQNQVSEDDMGLSFEELEAFGKLRMLDRCGPLSMFRKLLQLWRDRTAEEIAAKVKLFFKFYAINRHKMTTLPPSYHLENYSPDDNRFDQRQFLYEVSWTWQFRKIDEQLHTELTRKRSREQ